MKRTGCKLICLWLGLIAWSQLPAEAKRPNVVMIIADGHSYRDFGFFGNKTVHTPNIDRRVFRNALRDAVRSGSGPRRATESSWRFLTSVLSGRQERLGYAQTLEYYQEQHLINPNRIAKQFSEFGAGDCFSWFSFPGGHGFPGVTRRLTFAWFDRWLGRTLYK